MQERINLDFENRLSSGEGKLHEMDKTLLAHDIMLKAVQDDVSTLVKEIKQIRNALYVMAAAMAANIPALASAVDKLLVNL